MPISFNRSDAEVRGRWEARNKTEPLKSSPLGASMIRFADDPDGWLFFFRYDERGDPAYVPRQDVYESLRALLERMPIHYKLEDAQRVLRFFLWILSEAD